MDQEVTCYPSILHQLSSGGGRLSEVANKKREAALCRLLDCSHLTPTHWRIWILSAMGIFLDGFDLFIISIALPLIIRDLSPSPVLIGAIGSAAVIGAIFGASIGGILTDRFGRKSIYIVDLLLFIIFSFCCGIAWDISSLIIFRFLLGIGVGADYPICASYVSEFMPSALRGRMLIGAFAFQAVGMFAAAVVGLIILFVFPDPAAWRWMLIAGAIPAVIVLIARATVPESPRWYLGQGLFKNAARVICGLVPHKEAKIRECVAEQKVSTCSDPKKCSEFSVLFSREFRKRTILATVPWFLMDVAMYGVGIFMPILLAGLVFTSKGTSDIEMIYQSIAGSAFLDLFLLAGFLLNIRYVDTVGRIRLQIYGFIGMTLGMILILMAWLFGSNLFLVFSGFIFFNLLLNLGPNATTFILPVELFPTRVRGSAHGLASAIAKCGAATGIFLIPLIQNFAGIPGVLIVVGVVSMAGLIITLIFRIETSGQSLDELDPGVFG